eukprot:13774188-Heterocapsa_arctica.AAC.1
MPLHREEQGAVVLDQLQQLPPSHGFALGVRELREPGPQAGPRVAALGCELRGGGACSRRWGPQVVGTLNGGPRTGQDRRALTSRINIDGW